MAHEIYNAHLHDAGWFHFDWTYYTDASVDEGIRQFDAAAADGVDASEVADLLASAGDFDQITDREARQIWGALSRRTVDMTVSGAAMAGDVKAHLENAYPGHWVPALEILPGHFALYPLFYQDDERFRDGDIVGIKGADVPNLIEKENALADFLEIVHSPDPLVYR